MSNKMLKRVASATGLARKKPRFLIALIAVVIAGLFVATNRANYYSTYTQLAYLADVPLQLEIASTHQQRTRGLSGRDALGQNQGMLFVFEGPGPSCMWMKDMNFSIDVLWLDDEKTVVDSQQDIPPSSYPESFCSDKPARYFLELSAGFMSNNNIQTGAVLELR